MSDNEDFEDQEDIFEDCDDNQDSESLILSFDKDGKAEIKQPSDFVQVSKEDLYLIQGFITEHQDEFDDYIERIESEKKKLD